MKKILLLCNAGMSTSIVVKKMLEEAKKREMDILIEAVSTENFEENLDKFDVFLLGPQVRYKLDGFKEKAEKVGKKVDVINPMDYGTMRGDKILDQGLELLG